MLFHTFSSQEERRKFGGSDFIELQYCTLARGTEMEKIVSVDTIEHWKDSSLYLCGDDEGEFVLHYGKIFTGGIYGNGESGAADLCGINYYSPEQTRLIWKRVRETKPLDGQVLLRWLERAEEFLGFYLLGL